MLVATCAKEVVFFAFQNGVLKGSRGTGWGKSAKQEATLCHAFVDNTLITGQFSGPLLLWNGKSISKSIEAHTETCNAICNRVTKKGIITGGNDGAIIVWAFGGGGLQQEKKLDLKDQAIKSLSPKVRSVCEHTSGLILVGTRGGEIVEFGGAKPVVHLRSHFQDELWGLAPHPSKAEFVTVG